MLRYAIRRIAQLVPATLGILLVTFVIFNVVGGSAAQAVLGQHADAASIAAFNARYGYDRPLLLGPLAAPAGTPLRVRVVRALDSQFFNYCRQLLRGDFGESAAYGMRVADVLKSGVGPSLCITIPILFGGTLLGLALAMVAASRRGGAADSAILLGSTLCMSVNYVVWILAGQFLLSYKLRLFPIWGFEGAAYVVLPVAIGILSGLGRDIRYFRAVLLDETGRQYVRAAYSRGLSRRAVFLRHILPNAMIPVVTYVSLSIPYLFTGSLLLESFFGIPGLGGVSVNAIHSGDLATVRAVVILGAMLYQLVNLATDLCYAWLDPRVGRM
ncbi:MAG: ABC transporter permease [Kiritimatiellae bacterium]|nr:ABC transporter permease [Kiritimatiellia bacterium]